MWDLNSWPGALQQEQRVSHWTSQASPTAALFISLCFSSWQFQNGPQYPAARTSKPWHGCSLPHSMTPPPQRNCYSGNLSSKKDPSPESLPAPQTHLTHPAVAPLPQPLFTPSGLIRCVLLPCYLARHSARSSSWTGSPFNAQWKEALNWVSVNHCFRIFLKSYSKCRAQLLKTQEEDICISNPAKDS